MRHESHAAHERRPAVPTSACVELANEIQEPGGRTIHMRRQLSDLFAQAIQLCGDRNVWSVEFHLSPPSLLRRLYTQDFGLPGRRHDWKSRSNSSFARRADQSPPHEPPVNARRAFQEPDQRVPPRAFPKLSSEKSRRRRRRGRETTTARDDNGERRQRRETTTARDDNGERRSSRPIKADDGKQPLRTTPRTLSTRPANNQPERSARTISARTIAPNDQRERSARTISANN